MEIKKILADLYELDPKLKIKEKELKVLIEELLENKKYSTVNAQFKKALKVRIEKEFGTAEENIIPAWKLWQNWSFAGGGILVGGLLVMLLGTVSMESDGILDSSLALQKSGLNDFAREEFTEEGSFGEDSFSGTSSYAPVAPGFGGGLGMADSRLYPPMGHIVYEYDFQGELPPLQSNIDLLLKSKTALKPSLEVLNFLKDYSSVDWNNLESLEMSQLTLFEDKKNGYQVHLDFNNDMLGVSPNSYWEYPGQDCRDEACFKALQVSIDEVPEDAVLLGMAQEFIEDFDLNLSKYGEPVLENHWRRQYEKSEHKSEFIPPSVMTVIYPLVVEGKSVYGQWGGLEGMRVSIDLRLKKASGFYGYDYSDYNKVSVPGIIDKDLLKKFIKNGGDNHYISEEAEIKNVALENVKIEWMKVWKTVAGVNQELLVPALVFPINENEERYMMKQDVVIPLVEEFLPNNDYGEPGIMELR